MSIWWTDGNIHWLRVHFRFTAAVTVERALAIRSPFRHAHSSWKRMIIGIVVIFSLAFCLTFYYNFWYIKVPVPTRCGDPTAAEQLQNFVFVPVTREQEIITPRIRKRLNLTETSATVTNYVKASVIIGASAIVVGPLIVLIILNAGLIYYVKQSHRAIQLAVSQEQDRQAKERKITIMICVIVGSFIILNCPSAALHLWSLMSQVPRWHFYAAQVSNSLVITNKAINFILYCLSSENFRKKAWAILCCRLTKGPQTSARRSAENASERMPLHHRGAKRSENYETLVSQLESDQVITKVTGETNTNRKDIHNSCM